MIDESINKKRIRDHAPFRKSMSLTESDIGRAAELERLFSSKFSSECPFNFSKTISKALELAILQMLQPEIQTSRPVQQSLTGQAADQDVLQARQLQRQSQGAGSESASRKPEKQGTPKKFQKTKRGF